MLCLCDGAIFTLWVFFANFDINALKFCKIVAQHMLRKSFSRFEPGHAYKRYAYKKHVYNIIKNKRGFAM